MIEKSIFKNLLCFLFVHLLVILSLRQENPDQDCTDEKHKRRIDDYSRCDGSGPRNPAHCKPDGLDLPFDFDEAASGVDPSPDEKWNR